MSLSAEELKNKGNEYFKNQQYELAISMYSQAIEQDGSIAIYYANRANAYFQDGLFKAAADDAMKAIEIDEKYMKAYWRMAEVSRCIGKSEEALSWYKKAHDLEPKNKKIAEQLIQIHQVVKMEQQSKKNILAGLGGYESRYAPVAKGSSSAMSQYNSMNRMFSSPFGVSGSAPTTVSEVGRDFEISDNLLETYKTVDERTDFLERFFKYCGESKVLHSEQLKKLVNQCAESLNKFETFNRLTFKDDAKITVVGDLHGSRNDFLRLFGDICTLKSFMNSQDYLVVLGDFVDRGPDGHQILCFVVALQLLCPERVFLVRGNHETPALNGFFGYQSQLETFYGTAVVPTAIIAPLFQALPLLLIVDQKDRRYAFFHGGLPVAATDINSIDDLFSQMPPKALEPNDPISQQLLWSDPMHEVCNMEIKPSHRGVGYIYSSQAYTTMRQKLGVSVSFRGHEMVLGQIGLRDDFDDQTHYTVFSSSDYMGQPNIGAVAIIVDGKISPIALK